MTVYSKEEIALAQLETALDLYERGTDLLPVINLAGAAEEILGKLVARTGGQAALQTDTEVVEKMFALLWPKEVPPAVAAFVERANRARNALKHLNAGGGPIELNAADEAKAMLDRAVTNYWRLREDLTPKIKRFVDKQIDTKPVLEPPDEGGVGG